MSRSSLLLCIEAFSIKIAQIGYAASTNVRNSWPRAMTDHSQSPSPSPVNVTKNQKSA